MNREELVTITAGVRSGDPCTAGSPTTVGDILDFWFGDGDPDGYDRRRSRELWFAGTPAVDAAIRERFLSGVEDAERGAYADWQEAPQSCLALILLLDQFPLNIFRRQARGYRLGEQALPVARRALQRGHDAAWNLNQRVFGYLPLVHSEELADQDRAVELFAALRHRPGMQGSYDSALRHREVIRRFGRFPHRNAALGRESTPAESEFLQSRRRRF